MSVAGLIVVVASAVGAVAPGVYRLDVEVIAVAAVPVMGAQRTVTKTTSLLEVDEQGIATARACRVETRGPGFSSRMPPTSLRGLPASRFTLWQEGAVVRADMGEGTIGYRGTGPIPSSPDDPRVIDPDGDGKPGLQLLLDVGAFGVWTLQVVSRGHTALRGTVTPTGVEGTLTLVESEEQVISGLPVKLPSRTTAIDPGACRFSLTPVRRGDESFCAW